MLAIVLGQPSLPGWVRPQRLIRYLHRHAMQFNSRRKARSNVARHYELDSRLCALFLDFDLQYGCAYFESADQSLDDAQIADARSAPAR